MINEKVKLDPDLQNVCVPEVPFVVHRTNPTDITWGEEIPGASGFYKSVLVDGVEYHVRPSDSFSCCARPNFVPDP